MATLWWKSLPDFERDLRSADEARLEVMRKWADGKEDEADAPGPGRAPKARRLFRQMRVAAQDEIARRRSAPDAS
ncbi:hypothetical protein [Arthrobacter sp. RAF14]|uniref:hypothetical protein n=1 Tax=Arthrobacter sp. RAF14 TaxID=3233051 RepID=UPI003F921124